MEPTLLTQHHLFPLFLDLHDRAVLVVGAGTVAERRVDMLLRCGASITLVAPTATTVLRELAAANHLKWVDREFAEKDLEGQSIVFTATGLHDTDQTITAAARALGIFVNAADHTALCDFHVPATERRGDIQVAVSTGGSAPGLAAVIRDRIARSLGPEWELLARRLRDVRLLARTTVPDSSARMDAVRRASADQTLLAAIARGHEPSSSVILERALAGLPFVSEESSPAVEGRVSIVGAGPGDPALITLLGLEKLRSADVVVHDDLVDRRLLSEAPPHAEFIYSGKRGWKGGHDRPGPELLVGLAREGRHVVRLKGGDPGIFGRLDEEIRAIRDGGVPFEIVPGITAAVASAAAARMPLTQRHGSPSVTLTSAIATANGDETLNRSEIVALVRAGGTVAVYMGLRSLPELERALLEANMDPQLPAAVIQGAFTPEQTIVSSTLSELAVAVSVAGIGSPALVILGEVAALADSGQG